MSVLSSGVLPASSPSVRHPKPSLNRILTCGFFRGPNASGWRPHQDYVPSPSTQVKPHTMGPHSKKKQATEAMAVAPLELQIALLASDHRSVYLLWLLVVGSPVRWNQAAKCGRLSLAPSSTKAPSLRAVGGWVRIVVRASAGAADFRTRLCVTSDLVPAWLCPRLHT